MDGFLGHCPNDLFEEWKAFYAIDPFGDKRDDVRSALGFANVLSAMGAKNMNLDRFIITKDEPGDYDEYGRRKMSTKEMQCNLMAAFGGRVRRVVNNGS